MHNYTVFTSSQSIHDMISVKMKEIVVIVQTAEVAIAGHCLHKDNCSHVGSKLTISTR